jgi:hypothetical protein
MISRFAAGLSRWLGEARVRFARLAGEFAFEAVQLRLGKPFVRPLRDRQCFGDRGEAFRPLPRGRVSLGQQVKKIRLERYQACRIPMTSDDRRD